MSNSIIFVDSSVQDYQSLIKDSTAAKIVILNDHESGIEQITQALASEKDIAAIHILSHGSSGSLKLGSDTLNNQDLAQFSQEIQQWGKALTPNGDILLYGCDVGSGENGLQFVQNLHQLTGADMAASNDLTGSAALGGDWDLEIATGSIEAEVPLAQEAMDSYEYTLANYDVTVATDTGDDTVVNSLS